MKLPLANLVAFLVLYLLLGRIGTYFFLALLMFSILVTWAGDWIVHKVGEDYIDTNHMRRM